MHFTKKMMYMGFGCLLTLAGYILVSEVTTQAQLTDTTLSDVVAGGVEPILSDEELGLYSRYLTEFPNKMLRLIQDALGQERKSTSYDSEEVATVTGATNLSEVMEGR